MAANDLIIQVKKGVPYRVDQVDSIPEGADAHITTSDERKLRVSVKQLTEKKGQGVSSKVVDVTMCG